MKTLSKNHLTLWKPNSDRNEESLGKAIGRLNMAKERINVLKISQ